MRPPLVQACGVAASRGYWCRVASLSQVDVAHGQPYPVRLQVDLTMRRGLHGGDEGLPRDLALEAAKLLGRNDDHFVAPIYCDMLRPLASCPPYQLAEASLRILQHPIV